MKKQLYAPETDALTESIRRETAPVNFAIYQKLKNVHAVFICIKTIGGDELRETVSSTS